jgi:uncharacterized protein (TIGR00299 family) protein
MVKALYFDCFSGISGDMAMAALLDLGIDAGTFRDELRKLDLPGYDLTITKKSDHSIAGTDVVVMPDHASGHPQRNLEQIETIIDQSGLKPDVKHFSKKVFGEIARAEAAVHDQPLDEVHFHEVGAIDSIVDIVGTAICLDLLGVERVFSSPLHDGKGFIECRHGLLPVPVPAVMKMLAGSHIPLVVEDVETELVTPTGMGIIKSLTVEFGNMPAMTIAGTGYGLGKRQTGRLNALRVVMGTLSDSARPKDCLQEEIVVLATNIDDTNPELLGFTMETLLEAGALDVFFTPVYMKKNRPAVKLTVIVNKDDEKKAVGIILAQTSTIGVQRSVVQRYCMDRQILTVETGLGAVRVKVAQMGEIKKLAPEYEDCRALAKKTGMPLAKIYSLACASADHLPISEV